MEMSSANYCPHCGAEVQGDSLFCATCGRPLVGGGDSGRTGPLPHFPGPHSVFDRPFVGALHRLLALQDLEALQGAYGRSGVPNLARADRLCANLRLLQGSRPPAHFWRSGHRRPGCRFRLSRAWPLAHCSLDGCDCSLRKARQSHLCWLVVSIAAQLWMMLHAQPRINYYWDNAYGARLRGMSIGKGEVVIVIIGVLGWLGTLTSIFVDPTTMQNGGA